VAACFLKSIYLSDNFISVGIPESIQKDNCFT